MAEAEFKSITLRASCRYASEYTHLTEIGRKLARTALWLGRADALSSLECLQFSPQNFFVVL